MNDSQISVYPVGSLVTLNGDMICGHVTRIELSESNQIRYEVAYWFESKQITVWVYSFEVDSNEREQKVSWIHPLK